MEMISTITGALIPHKSITGLQITPSAGEEGAPCPKRVFGGRKYAGRDSMGDLADQACSKMILSMLADGPKARDKFKAAFSQAGFSPNSVSASTSKLVAAGLIVRLPSGIFQLKDK
jgi:hypothetical protein